MTSALIGYTGFVGGNLDAAHAFTHKYNSKNIAEIDGQEFDLVVSAATRAEMWRINQEPDVDWAEITALMEHLKTIKAKQFVLISTVAVFNPPYAHTEDDPVDLDGLPPYGTHRYKLEEFCKQQFPNCLIVRLPGLFGEGLKKNVIFDLLTDNNLQNIHRGSIYQYYNLANLWKDIQIALENNVTLLHVTAEPIRTDELARACFGIDFTNEPAGFTPKSFEFKSKYAKLFGGQGDYLYTKEQTLDMIKQFVTDYKAGAR